jgi:hypothetical protein
MKNLKTTMIAALLMLAAVGGAVASESSLSEGLNDFLALKRADTLKVKGRDGQPGKKYEFEFTALKDADITITGLWINTAHVSFDTRVRIDATSSKPLVNPKKGERVELDYNTLSNQTIDKEPVPLKSSATAVIQFIVNGKTYYSEVKEFDLEDFIQED